MDLFKLVCLLGTPAWIGYTFGYVNGRTNGHCEGRLWGSEETLDAMKGKRLPSNEWQREALLLNKV